MTRTNAFLTKLFTGLSMPLVVTAAVLVLITAIPAFLLGFTLGPVFENMYDAFEFGRRTCLDVMRRVNK